MADFTAPTIQSLGALIQKPKMSQNLLQKPPFKYLFDILMEVQNATGFGNGLYTDAEKSGDYYDSKEKKILFLRKAIEMVQYVEKQEIAAKPNKIVAGLEPENTNVFLQLVAKIASKKQNLEPLAKKINDKLAKEAGGDAQPTEQKAEPQQKQEAKAPAKADPKPDPKQQQQQQQQLKKQPTQEVAEKKPDPKLAQPQTQEKTQPPSKQPQQKPKEPEKKEEPPVQAQPSGPALQRPSTASRRPPPVSSNVQVVDNVPKGSGPTGLILDKKGDDKEDSDIEDKPQAQQNNQNRNIDQDKHGKFIRDAIKQDDVEEQEQEDKQEGKGGIKISRKTAKKDGKSSQRQDGGVSGNDLDYLKQVVQQICQSANPLAKQLEYINDDIESMNHELQQWRKQYKVHNTKMQAQLKITEDELQPIYDKLAEIDEQIREKKSKIQNVKANIIKNKSTIQSLLYSVVAQK